MKLVSAKFLSLILMCLLFWGCGNKHGRIVIINDEAKLFDVQSSASTIKAVKGKGKSSSKNSATTKPIISRQEVEKQIHDLSDSKGIDVVVHTVAAPTVPPIKLAEYLDETFKKDSAWKANSGNVPSDSVEFIVLTTPKFVTVRFGDSARLRAIYTGLMSGSTFLSIQQHAAVDPIAGLNELLIYFRDHYPGPGQESLRERAAKWLFYEDLDKIITSVTLNHWGFYNRYLMAPTLYVQAKLGQYLPIWSAPFITVCFVLAIAAGCKKLLSSGIGLKGMLGWSALTLAIAFEVLCVMPSIGSLLMISHQRLEDHMFVQALLSPDLAKFSPLLNGSTSNFSGHTGFFWALCFALMVSLSILSEGASWFSLAELPHEKQAAIFSGWSNAKRFAFELAAKSYFQDSDFNENRPFSSISEAVIVAAVFRPIKYFVLYFYLPFPISLVLCNRMLIQTAMRLRSNWKSYKLYKSISTTNSLSSESAHA